MPLYLSNIGVKTLKVSEYSRGQERLLSDLWQFLSCALVWFIWHIPSSPEHFKFKKKKSTKIAIILLLRIATMDREHDFF